MDGRKSDYDILSNHITWEDAPEEDWLSTEADFCPTPYSDSSYVNKPVKIENFSLK